MEQFNWSFKNGTGDLSAHQYKAVKLSADNTVVLVTAAADHVLGVMQTSPLNANENIGVCIVGVSKMKAGASVNYNDKLKVTTSATFIAAGSGDTVVGIAYESVASGGTFWGSFFGNQVETVNP